MPQKYAFLDPDKLLQKPGGARGIRPGHRGRLRLFRPPGHAWARPWRERKFLINIDHHQSNTRYGDLNWISAREASTGELIFRLLQAASWPITPAIADCLFTAVSTDTGSFQYPTTKPVTYHTAGELVRLGANLDTICHEVYQSFSLSRVRLLKHVYNHFHLTHNNQIAWLWLKKKDFARTGADRSDTEGLIDHIRAIEPVVVACVFEEVGAGPDPHQPALQIAAGQCQRNRRAIWRRRPRGRGRRAHRRQAPFRAAPRHRPPMQKGPRFRPLIHACI